MHVVPHKEQSGKFKVRLFPALRHSLRLPNAGEETRNYGRRGGCFTWNITEDRVSVSRFATPRREPMPN